MRILGIETATMMIGVALLDERGLLAECRFQASKARSERLMPMIDHVLKDSLCKPEELDGLAVSIGPGSFTGLRIGVSTAKGLSFALNLPAVAISTLEALATPGADWQSPSSICPMIDAKRHEVYAGLFRVTTEGGLRRISEEAVVSPTRLAEDLAARHEPVLFLGTGTLLYETEIKKQLGDLAIFSSRADPYPSPAVVAELGRKKILSEGAQATALTPVYLSRFEIKPQLQTKVIKNREC